MAAPFGDDITIVHWAIGGAGGLIGAACSALWFTWAFASRSTEMRKDIAQAAADIADLKRRDDAHVDDLRELRETGDSRHEQNLRAMGQITATVAALPDKRDFQRLEDQFRSSIGEVKQLIATAR